MASPELILLLSPFQYSETERRYKSLAFKNSTGGGVSVIDAKCVASKTERVCEHIEEFYPPRLSGTPAAFWKIPAGYLKDDLQLEQEDSAVDPSTGRGGDDCHYNIKNMSDKECKKKLLEALDPDLVESKDNFFICDEDGFRLLTHADVVAQRQSLGLTST